MRSDIASVSRFGGSRDHREGATLVGLSILGAKLASTPKPHARDYDALNYGPGLRIVQWADCSRCGEYGHISPTLRTTDRQMGIVVPEGSGHMKGRLFHSLSLCIMMYERVSCCK